MAVEDGGWGGKQRKNVEEGVVFINIEQMRKSISRADVENITDIYRYAFTTVTRIHPLMPVVESPSTPQRPAKIFDISNGQRATVGNDCTVHCTIVFVGPKVLGEARFCSYLIFFLNKH